MSGDDRDNWLQRWARRKSAARTSNVDAPTDCDQEEPGTAPPDASDVENLHADSDFSRFLGKDVAPEVRQAALRRLWSIVPEISRPDGLIDYGRNYGAAVATAEVTATAIAVDPVAVPVLRELDDLPEAG